MVDWANVRWWVSFVTSNPFGGVSLAKDWLKHLVPVLWPKDKAKANSEPEAELSTTLRMDLLQDLQKTLDLLTVARDLNSQAEKREESLVGLEADLNKRSRHLTELESRLGLWEKDLQAREDALPEVEEACSALERSLRGLFSDINGIA
ncbi:hypothetical protein BDV39DRAFT_202081 [Aspergillus sergii]|uniref:Uncharacterized protein n=1 Tax=Aspergillus sergii TaxID=1034303 RepID=A0A5N6XAI4_9EURO|nr:hypothetical protein BDV39DRAFT_202081 [Aspergillus sergii]